jgi:hypothetical protein
MVKWKFLFLLVCETNEGFKSFFANITRLVEVNHWLIFQEFKNYFNNKIFQNKKIKIMKNNNSLFLLVNSNAKRKSVRLLE